jgi:hypothetical protein
MRKTPKADENLKEDSKDFATLDFKADVTSYLPPKHEQYISG